MPPVMPLPPPMSYPAGPPGYYAPPRPHPYPVLPITQGAGGVRAIWVVCLVLVLVSAAFHILLFTGARSAIQETTAAASMASFTVLFYVLTRAITELIATRGE